MMGCGGVTASRFSVTGAVKNHSKCNARVSEIPSKASPSLMGLWKFDESRLTGLFWPIATVLVLLALMTVSNPAADILLLGIVVGF